MTAVYYLHLPLAATKVGSLMDTVVALTYESLALARLATNSSISSLLHVYVSH